MAGLLYYNVVHERMRMTSSEWLIQSTVHGEKNYSQFSINRYFEKCDHMIPRLGHITAETLSKHLRRNSRKDTLGKIASACLLSFL
nr:AlNc14C67G4725 [Albugo laibachii Nc14]|eukprot:CCA19280.1 AlNc14C67G4725 [Albugo laibachii Nc14]